MLGRLARLTVAGTTTDFLYDGDALVGEYVGASLTRRYVHGGQVDEPLVQYNGASVGTSYRRYLHADHQGSIIAHTTNAGAIAQTNAYDPYGIPKSTNDGRFGYTGQTWIKELGLNYYKARIYSPKLGRFLQTDPIFYEDDMNLYAYVGNDPLNGNDPTGNAGVSCAANAGCNAQTTGGTRTEGITISGVQSGLGAVSAGARGVEVAGKAAVGFGPPSAVVPGLTASRAASSLRGAVGPLRSAVSAAQIGTNLHDGNVRGAVTNGLELGERLAGAAIGAQLGGKLSGPFAEIGVPIGAALGALAPSLMTSVNDAIVEAGAAGIQAVSEAYDEVADAGGAKLMEAGAAVKNHVLGCGQIGAGCGN